MSFSLPAEIRATGANDAAPIDLTADAQQFLGSLSTVSAALSARVSGMAAEPTGVAAWRALLASAFLRDCALREAAYFERAIAGLGAPFVPSGDELSELLSREGAERGLRCFRRRCMLHIGLRDLGGLADLDETLASLSRLADLTIAAALRVARAELAERFGRPVAHDGAHPELLVLAMGKLGGRELNFSSDIDLIFAHGGGGETDGPRTLSANEFFTRQAQRVIALLDRTTRDGRVFRVDTRLRPFGDSGPLIVSLAALESYLQQHGRDWERYAYVKARFLGEGGADAGEPAAASAFRKSVLRPFVYRRYLDYGVIASIRDMKAMIEEQVVRRELRDHLKLGPGGIREIEFIVQSWQLIRGGQIPALRTNRLVEALRALAALDYLPADVAARLETAYRYLRTLENRLQALGDEQVHDLPDDAASRARLALAMGERDWAAVEGALAGHRRTVREQFANLVFGDDAPETVRSHATEPEVCVWLDGDDDAVSDRLNALGLDEPGPLLESLQRFRAHLERVPLDSVSAGRLRRFINRLFSDLPRSAHPGDALARVLQVATAVLRRSAYLSLLIEHPLARRRLIELCGLSDYLTRELAEHPVLLDELLDPRLYGEPLDEAELEAGLNEAFALREVETDGDPEEAVRVVAQYQRAMLFRVAVVDCSGLLPIMRVSDCLTHLAELAIRRTLAIAWNDLAARHGAPSAGTGTPGFAIVAYGKLGGIELGYGSDLDLVFLHDIGDGETDGPKPIDNSVFLMRLARRIVHFLGVQTGAGQMYEVDMRLRPSGRSGLLVSGLEAFERYQREDAWTWEHQSLLRSRAVAGDPAVCRAFDEIRHRTLVQAVRRDSLAEDVVKMRARMRKELSAAGPGEFDIKQDAGGVTDLEFIVQYLVLQRAPENEALLRWSDNIRQLDELSAAGVLSPEDAAALQDAYRAFRQRLHRLSLDDAKRVVADDEFVAERALVGAIWQRLFAGVPDEG